MLEAKSFYTPKWIVRSIFRSWQLLAWLVFYPSAWRKYVQRIDRLLASNFCLGELNLNQWRHPSLYHLLEASFIVLPITIGGIVALTLEIAGVLDIKLVWGILLGIMVGFTFAVIINLPSGIVASVVIVAAFGSIWGTSGSLTADLVMSTNPTFGKIFGTLGGLVGYVSITTSRESSPRLIKERGQTVASSLSGALLALGIVIGTLLGGTALWENSSVAGLGISIGTGLIVAITLGLALSWRLSNWRSGLMWGGFFGFIIGSIFVYFMGDIAFGQEIIDFPLLVLISIAAIYCFFILFLLPYIPVEYFVGPQVAAVIAVLAGQFIYFVAELLVPLFDLWANVRIGIILTLLGLTIGWWRPLLFYPWHLVWGRLIYLADERAMRPPDGRLYWQAAFWDEHQWLPLFGLDRHIVLIHDHYPTTAQAALDYLSTSRQRWSVQATQIELDARYLEQLTQIVGLSQAHRRLAAGELEGPASALLRSFSHISQDIEAALNQVSIYHQRLALKAISDSLNGLLRELNRSHERYAPRFRPITVDWQHIVDEYIVFLIKSAELRQEIDNPYIIGIPLTAHQEIFVGRTDISRQIENLLLDRRRPPLLLYGQRRMGKTSLLNNLGRLLPKTIIPLFVDLQGPVSYASDHAGLFYNMARSMIHSAEKQRNISLPLLSRDALTADPFTTFDEWLDKVEAALPQQTILLALDEFEALDSGFREGRFSERAVLSMLRHIIQHRLKFKVLLAGSHTLDEFQRWSSYLINAQVIPINYLSEPEAQQLIVQPVKDFALHYLPQAQQRIIQLTRGHPFLLQLLCGEIVALKNEQVPERRRIATVTDVEAAVPKALSRGSMFFADIEQNQVNKVTLPLLQFMAREDKGIKSHALSQYAAEKGYDLEKVLASLIQRELIAETGGVYYFQVELVRLWFRG